MDCGKEEFVGILQENKKNMTVKQEGKKFQQYFCAIIGEYRLKLLRNYFTLIVEKLKKKKKKLILQL